MPNKPRKPSGTTSLKKAAKTYRKSTKKDVTTTNGYYSGSFGENPKMDAQAKKSFPNLKAGDTYSLSGNLGTQSSTRVTSKGSPRQMTYGGTRGNKGATIRKKGRAS